MLHNEAGKQTALTGVLNELELAKMLAHKYSKSFDYSDESERKNLSKEEFRNICKVWSGFIKFIKSQVI